MHFNTFEAWRLLCHEHHAPLWQIALEAEVALAERSREEIYEAMLERFRVMQQSVERGLTGIVSHSGLSGGDAKKMKAYQEQGGLLGPFGLKSMSYAIAINECNAAMGVICATPTAGSAGTCAAVLLAAKEELGLSEKDALNFLITAGSFGRIIGNGASLSGAAGGCQAEVGSASAMAAGALTEALGGTPEAAGHAAAMALKNVLGLACDPVAGLVEIPCIKRNVMGAVNAISATEMALAGIVSKIPFDEVIEAMGRVGAMLPLALRETALGGLAATKTAKRLEAELAKRD